MDLPIELFDNDLNTEELDNKKCAYCGKVPPTRTYLEMDKKNHFRQVVDRSSRIDCDGGKGEHSKPVTYHKECWLIKVFEEKYERANQ